MTTGIENSIMKTDLESLKEEIERLPKGYISNKKIGGKIRHYLQWKENEKTKSKYIPDEDYERILSQVRERKNLEKRLASIEYVPSSNFQEKYLTHVIAGKELKALVSPTHILKKRDSFKMLTEYLYGEITPRVCSIYGLRRTGKTTMLFQAIDEMNEENLSKTVYIKIRKGQNMSMLDHDLKILQKEGYKFIFLDEITFMEGFIDTASFLSDIYAAMGMKIVLSGTDSLEIWFASKYELYDRTYFIHTTWIPFSEHARLLGTNDIDEYIRYGGTLRAGEVDFDDESLREEEISFYDDESTRRYIDTAICKNIQHSLECFEDGSHFRKLRELYEANELTGAINRIIENMNHRFVVDTLTKDFQSSDLHLAKRNLLKERNLELRSDALEKIDEEKVIRRLMEILDIENKENQRVNITAEHVREIKEYLSALELIEECPVRYLGAKKEETDSNVLFTQPGMRYCQAEALVFSLKKDEIFSSISAKEKDYVCNKILDGVKGRMLEEIVLYESMRKLKNKYDVFKLEFLDGEFDMVQMNKETYECKIFEIKHSKLTDPSQYRHINNEERCRETEKMFGKIIGKYVLYRGQNVILGNGVQYLNVENYLKSL